MAALPQHLQISSKATLPIWIFNVGDWVLLRLQPYRQKTVAHCTSQKLAKHYFGPYSIRRRIGKVAYELDLPSSAKIHPVVHVSLLRPYRGDNPSSRFKPLPVPSHLPFDQAAEIQPVEALDLTHEISPLIPAVAPEVSR